MSALWRDVCAEDDVKSGSALHVPGNPELAIFRVRDEWFATEGYCPHGAVSLADAYVEDGAVIECSAHLARFCLRTGDVLAPPADRPLRLFPVRTSGGRVLVEIPAEVA